jgi:arylsulfatase A-like enzyme
MTPATPRLTTLEQLGLGVLVGALAGGIAGIVEYLLLMRDFSGDPGRAYWNIVIPYLVLGAAGGLLLAILLRVATPATATASQQTARLAAAVVSVVVLAYLLVWITDWLDVPVFKISNLIGYLAAIALSLGLALVLQRALSALLGLLERRWDRKPVSFRLALPLVVAVLVLLAVLGPVAFVARAHSVQPVAAGPVAATADATRPTIVFILIDALRADHLPLYGYSRQTSPNLVGLASQGMTFSKFYAQASSTRPSIATIFSSLYPSVHKANEDRDVLSSSVTVLPQVLKNAGYSTFGISANANISPTFGYAQGFDSFSVWKIENEFRVTTAGRLADEFLSQQTLRRLLREHADIVPTADVITDRTLAWVRENGGRNPMFLYVHYIDPHDPYSPPPPYDRKFDYRSEPPRRAGVDPLTLIGPGKDRDSVGRTLDLYDGEILYADHHVGRLLKGLEDRGVLRNALVIVTADHGEEFWEHGNEKHGRSAYEEVLHVPFIMWWPGKVAAGTRFEGVAGHIDLMPTLLNLLGLPAPAHVQGHSFAAQLMDPSAAMPSRLLAAQVIQGGFTIEAMREGRNKYIRHTRGRRAGSQELYDLQEDPLERRNQAEQTPARVSLLKKALDAFDEVLGRTAAQVPAEQAQKIDKDTERALRSLGYIK